MLDGHCCSTRVHVCMCPTLFCAVLCPGSVTMSPRGTYEWEETKPDLKELELECEFGATGMARRRCNRNGTWGKPNVTECYGKTEDIMNSLDNVS